MNKTFPTLYKKTKNGKIQQWSIQVVDNEIITTYGYTDGLKQTAREVVKEGKNIGKSNETTVNEQALAQAQSEWSAKVSRKGYSESVDAPKDKSPTRPMLAHSYIKYSHKVVFPCIGQSKYDGLRMLCTVKEDHTVSLTSREQKPIVAIPHINKALEEFNLPVDTVLDGELYTHIYKNDFEKIVSSVKRKTPIKEDNIIQYHVYDIVMDKGYPERAEYLKTIVKENNFIKLAPYKYLNDEEELFEFYQEQLDAGYEGAMIRSVSSPYEEGHRSYSLLKLKEFEDHEFDIVGVEEGTGKMLGKAIFVCKTKEGEVFTVKKKGALDLLSQYLTDETLWKGKQLTVQHCGWTKDNKPRFPVGKAIRDYE